VDGQLRERRRNFKRRYESLDRIQSASNELDTRLQEVQAHDERVLQLQTRLGDLIGELITAAEHDPMAIPPTLNQPVDAAMQRAFAETLSAPLDTAIPPTV